MLFKVSGSKGIVLAATALAVFLGACGQAPTAAETNAKTQTVDIPITKVKDQRRVGFCWSYAIAALVESQYLLRTDQTINISEEALGFYRMAEQLHYFSKEYTGVDLNSAVDTAVLDGYWAIYNENPYLDGFRLVKKYGLVPDSIWSYKFGGANDSSGDLKIADIKKAFKTLMKGKAKGSVTIDQIMSKALIASGAYPSKPPANFNWQGQNYSAKDFALSFLKFNPDNFDVVNGWQAGGYENLIGGLKRTLASGKPALLSFDVYDGFINGGDLSAGDAPTNDKRYSETYSGRHMVLATDFVNDGGRPGGMTEKQIRSEVEKPGSELDYIVFKNSWGYANWNSSSKRMIEPGMFTMDRSYILGNLANGNWELVLPKEFVADPLAPYSVPSKVTGTDELSTKELTRTRNYVVTADELNCRKAPGIENEILTVLYASESLFGLGFEADKLGQQWMRVLVGDRSSNTQTKCYVRALKNYMNLTRIGSIACPAGFELQFVGRELGRYCMSPEKKVLGPFPEEMILKCIDWGGGEDACRNSRTWGQSLALSARGYGQCPLGSFYDFDVDYCSDGTNVYGPFPENLVNRCLAFTNGSAACSSARWSRKVLFYLQRSEN